MVRAPGKHSGRGQEAKWHDLLLRTSAFSPVAPLTFSYGQTFFSAYHMWSSFAVFLCDLKAIVPALTTRSTESRISLNNRAMILRICRESSNGSVKSQVKAAGIPFGGLHLCIRAENSRSRRNFPRCVFLRESGRLEYLIRCTRSE